jgi:phosphonatase-like hydrolase
MSFAAALEETSFLDRPISPYREFGAYEALWTEKLASFKWIAEKFSEHPGALPSDFIPEAEALKYAQAARDILSDAGVDHFGVIIHGATEYPEKLRSAEYPIELVYFQRWWDLIDSKSVAVVGTREPSDEDRARAKKLVRHLVEDDFTVVSGLAKGIDTVVHKTTLDAGGRTIAVIGTPLSLRYPKETTNLQDRIAKEHLLISQVPVVRYQQAKNPTTNAAEIYKDFSTQLTEAFRAVPPIPGVEEAIRKMRENGYLLATTTGFDCNIVVPIFRRLGWEKYFAAIIASDDVAEGRPSPYMLFHAMEAARVKNVAEVMAVGDTPLDLQAASNAGLRGMVGVLSGVGTEDQLRREPHTQIIKSVADLPAILGPKR